jgi:hypothetical protein
MTVNDELDFEIKNDKKVAFLNRSVIIFGSRRDG